MDEFLRWLLLTGVVMFIVTILYALFDKIRRERNVQHKIHLRHFLDPFSDVTDTKHDRNH